MNSRETASLKLESQHSCEEISNDSITNTNWFAVGIVISAGIVAALQVGKVIVAVPLLRADLGLDLAAVGWVLSIFSVLGVIGGIPTGMAVRRFGDRRILVLGLLAIVISSAIGSFISSYIALLGTRVIEGFGFLLIVIAAPDLLRRIVATNDQDRAFAIWSCFMPIGIAMALFISPFLTSWRGLWLANSVLAAIVIVLVMRSITQGLVIQEGWSWRGLGHDTILTVKADGPMLLTTIFALYALLFFALFSFLPVLLEQRMNVSTVMASILTGIAIGASILGNLAAGALLEHGVVQWKIIAIASLIMGLTGLGIFLPLLPNFAVFGACIIFSGVGGLIPATVIASIPTLAPSVQLTPVSFGLVMQGNNLGQLIGPVAVGTLVGVMGWSMVAVFIALGGIAGMILAMALRRSFQNAKSTSTTF